MKEVIIPNLREGGDGKHLKILVEIDLKQPLLRGTIVRINGIIKLVDLRYEKCLYFSYYCGLMGHNKKNYKIKGANLNKEISYGA